MNFKSPRTKVTSERYKFFNQSLSKLEFHSNLKFKLDNSKTLSTDSQLLQTDEKHLKSSFKLQLTIKSAFHTSFQNQSTHHQINNSAFQNLFKHSQIFFNPLFVPTHKHSNIGANNYNTINSIEPIDIQSIQTHLWHQKLNSP